MAGIAKLDKVIENMRSGSLNVRSRIKHEKSKEKGMYTVEES